MARRATNAKARGKSIILFSDGTGNSSAKLFKTNVWRMYEAVDLGPSPTGIRDQISFYDDGVGTSNFKFLAALGGAFGWGLKRNILDLYRYACRNYRKGDQIYGFGFSRGAFTIRLVVYLIASQGLVQSEDESDLNTKSLEAYRAWRREFKPRKFRSAAETTGKVRDALTTYDRSKNLDPTIRFVGVWDTVAAYGGPIAEITRAIDNWIYPLSMPDYELHESVKCARHALAIDDERDAFQPLLWDELAEERRADEAAAAEAEARKKARKARSETKRRQYLSDARKWGVRKRFFRTRMQQVWFTGMHADVGGGYPDESLSYVSLLWMMEEAENADLRTLASIKDRYFALANSYGPMHNSRAGIGSYYRYQPRKIAAWQYSAPAEDQSRYLMLRDPDIRDAKGNARGLLRCVCVHESVIARINSGTVRYAPIALPRSIQVVPPQREGEKVEQTDAAKPKCKYERPPSEPLITPKTRALVEGSLDGRFACQENLWDLVWRRRIAYFATLLATLLIVVLPLGSPLPPFFDGVCGDARCVIPDIVRAAGVITPGFADPWVAAIADHPISAALFALAIYLLTRWSGSKERELRDRSYHLWRRVLGGEMIGSPECPESDLRKFREGRSYQQFFRDLKWYALPDLFGILMVAVILYIPIALFTQASIQYKEGAYGFCLKEATGSVRHFERNATFYFDTSKPCVEPLVSVDKDQVYDVVFQLPVDSKGDPARWWDASIPSKPGLLTRVRTGSVPQFFGMPMRRVIEASYLQPIAEVTPMENRPWWRIVDWLRPLLPEMHRVSITKLQLVQDEDWPELYRVRFKAPHSGALRLFANDAQFLFWGRGFYGNNCGLARVTFTTILPRHRHVPPQELITEPGDPVSVPDCAKDEKRAKIVAAEESSAP